jgi:hypothetical protein
MITKRERRYAIALMMKFAADKGARYWDLGVMCMTAIGVTGEEIEDAVENFETPTADWNPMIAMLEHVNRDRAIQKNEERVGIKPPKETLN